MSPHATLGSSRDLARVRMKQLMKQLLIPQTLALIVLAGQWMVSEWQCSTGVHDLILRERGYGSSTDLSLTGLRCAYFDDGEVLADMNLLPYIPLAAVAIVSGIVLTLVVLNRSWKELFFQHKRWICRTKTLLSALLGLHSFVAIVLAGQWLISSRICPGAQDPIFDPVRGLTRSVEVDLAWVRCSYGNMDVGVDWSMWRFPTALAIPLVAWCIVISLVALRRLRVSI